MEVRLIDFDPHEHRRRIDDQHDRHAGTRFLSLLDLDHLPAAPVHPEHDEPRNWRSDDHAVGVLLGLLHRRPSAIPLNFEDPDFRCFGAAFQLEGVLQLLQTGLRLFHAEVVLLGVDLRQDLVLPHLEACRVHGMLRQRQLRIVFGTRLFLLRALLVNLFLEVEILSTLVERGLQLALAVELHQQIPLG